MQEQIELIREENKIKIAKAIQELDVVNYESVSKRLPKLLAEGLLKLDSNVYLPADPLIHEPHGVGRYLLYDNNPSNPLSIWIFAFAPRQKTTIHDHKYKGTVTVLEGPISEKFYEPTSKESARLKNRIDRYRFHRNGDDLNDTFVHQLKCRKGLGVPLSITLHIYNMEAQFVNFEGKKIDRRNLNMIYSKDKTDDKEVPPYFEVYPDSNEPLLYRM